MKKSTRVLVITIITALFLTIGLSNISASPIENNIDDQTKINNLLYKYFDTKYEAFSKNIDPDFSAFIDKKSLSIMNELYKIKLEIYANKINNLSFETYKYNLNIVELEINSLRNRATMKVLESHEVIYNISYMVNAKDPIITKLQDLEHLVEFVKINDEWKISSDVYEDMIWQYLNGVNIDDYHVKNLIDSNYTKIKNEVVTTSTPSCNLPYDLTSHDYDRYAVVDYARTWALSRNPEYYDFGMDDCTNFVSQAIHVGSLAGMSNESGSGWYYYDINSRGTAWTAVDDLFVFTTSPYERDYYYQSGPEGCELSSKHDLRLGDIVQFDFEPNDPEHEDEAPMFDHSVMITGMEYVYGEYFYYFSAHSYNYLDKPLDSVLTYLGRKFIRIERIDGELHVVFVPTIIKPSSTALSSVPKTTAKEESSSINTAYPAPGAASGTISTETPRSAYP